MSLDSSCIESQLRSCPKLFVGHYLTQKILLWPWPLGQAIVMVPPIREVIVSCFKLTNKIKHVCFGLQLKKSNKEVTNIRQKKVEIF